MCSCACTAQNPIEELEEAIRQLDADITRAVAVLKTARGKGVDVLRQTLLLREQKNILDKDMKLLEAKNKLPPPISPADGAYL